MPAPARGQNVAAAFAELAETLARGPELEQYLAAVCRHCVGLIGAQCVVVVYRVGQMEQELKIAASDDAGRRLAAGSPDPSQVPWAQSMATGELITVDDVRSRRDQWPWFAGHAAAAGFSTVTVVPLNTQANVTGALALLGGHAPDAHDILLTLSLADAASAGIALADELTRQEKAISQLQTALSSRIVIEQAKGILAERWQVTPDEAFGTLRRLARSTQRRLPELAVAVIEGTVEILPDKIEPK